MFAKIYRSLALPAAVLLGASAYTQATNSTATTQSPRKETTVDTKNGEARIIIQIENGAPQSRRHPPYRDEYSGPNRSEYPDSEYDRPSSRRAELDSHDWFDRCTTGHRELIRARTRADYHASYGRLDVAANELKAAIFRIADGDLSVRDRPSPGPHLSFAAREAKEIVTTSDSAIASLPESLRNQVDYLVSNALINTLISAYEELDQKYSQHVRRDCRDCWFDGLPREYFDGVRLLALKFVKLQRGLQEVIPSDLVEIKLAKSIAVSATRFLEAYTGRRAYCRALNELIELREWVCDYLQNPSYPSYELIDFIQRSLKKAEFELEVSKRDC